MFHILSPGQHPTAHHTTTNPPVFSTERRFALYSGCPYLQRLTRVGRFQPPAPGQKRHKEDWEVIWYVGMFGTFAAATVALYYKPDTRCAFSRGRVRFSGLTRSVRLQYPGMGLGRSQEADGGSRRGH